MSLKQSSASIGNVVGPYGEETLVCQFIHMTNSQGSTWFGGDPFSYTVPLLLAQFSLIFLVTSLVWLLLRPCKQGLISAQLIGGVIMGKSCLGRIKAYSEQVFPPGGRQILETCADLGFILYLFILGAHIDLNLVRKVERYAVVIGVSCFVVPLGIGLGVILIVTRAMELDSPTQQSLPFIASLTAISSFPVITSLLTDLNILNSEIGRIATLASLVSDICNYALSLVFGGVVVYLMSKQFAVIMSVICAIIFLLIIVFILRPMITCIANRVPQGHQMKESQFVVVAVLVLICGLGSEVLGQPAGLGTFILGVVIPDGGGLLANKMETFSTGLLVPAKFVISGLIMDFSAIRSLSGSAYGIVLFICYTSKFIAVFIPSLYYKLPTRDAVALALIMCCKGAIEAALYITLFEDGVIGREAYACLLLSMLMVTGIARPLIAHLYDPSSRYLGICKNSIMLNQPDDELRMLLCIHDEESVPTMMTLLDAMYGNRPITLFALNLMELKGRGAAVLEQTHHTNQSWSKALNSLAEKNAGYLVVRHFTSISPYASMHDDVCTLAADQVTNIVILPFHKQYTIDATVGLNSPSVRMVNQNVMAKSPCSVAILIDRGQFLTNQKSNHTFHVCLLFLGGMDDCEALAFCTGFIHNHMVAITFIWIRPWDHVNYTQQTMEIEMVNQFKAKTMGNQRITFKEELVKDAIDTTRVIGSIKDYDCDLCVVGRYHDADSEVLAGINEWSECPELGVIGDMLATPDFHFSVLVVQQQPPGADVSDYTALQPVASGYISSSRYSDCKDDFDSFHRV
ncbi:cation/H(+) antiporter 14-like [Salvia miltiorrhiza]|uniref:cation/H(+) antiporter 14-like n=1 Tax=Salvia miltiorrhiza TaxID=226208 RepID=UPI0025AC98C8|nr:cation/H(+) antiporter 14-like [Salvia miltiorrhiza]